MMASDAPDSRDSSLQPLNSLDCWDYSIELECLQGTQDLQLAAELGKTLLERNKELETALKQHQNVIEDQAQEIEYLTKQTVALREVNDSRLRIYEQLEVSIQDLERANHRLVLDNSAQKKHIKTSTATIEALEAKCEDLQTTIDDLRLQLDTLKRRARPEVGEDRRPAQRRRLQLAERSDDDDDDDDEPPEAQAFVESRQQQLHRPMQNTRCDESVKTGDELEAVASVDGIGGVEQMSQLLTQLREANMQTSRDQRKITELEEQLATVLQQNRALENQVIELHHRDDDAKSMHEEINTLEEVRRGQMCSRCLRNIDRNSDDRIPDDDDSSMLEELMATSTHRASFSMDVQAPAMQSTPASAKTSSVTNNLYKNLVEKYEALLEVHRKPLRNNNVKRTTEHCISLQEEFRMSGGFHIGTTKDTDEESGHGDSLRPEKPKTMFSQTPTDFSEAETSSSGFSDETSNKATQTDERSGAFLYSIADGEECQFTIYDDATSPIASRFQNRPEYQELFKEIFTVLKNAADNNDMGEPLPLLDEITPVKAAPPPPLCTPSPNVGLAADFLLDDDSQSVVSSTMSEVSISQNEPTTVIEGIIQAQNQPIPDGAEPPCLPHQEVVQQPSSGKAERELRPLVRQPLEYIKIESRRRSNSRRKNKHGDRSDSPVVTQIIGSPKINYSNRPSSGRRRREFRSASTTENHPADVNWSGNTLQFWASNRSNIASPTPSQGSGKVCFEFKPSSASQDLHKLKKLDLSYAEVLRNADSKKLTRQRKNK